MFYLQVKSESGSVEKFTGLRATAGAENGSIFYFDESEGEKTNIKFKHILKSF